MISSIEIVTHHWLIDFFVFFIACIQFELKYTNSYIYLSIE